jgi:hypothetical protein
MSSIHRWKRTAAALLLAGAGVAAAQEPTPGAAPPANREFANALLNISVTAGVDNPGGLVGLEADYRVFRYEAFAATAGLAGGIGMWGPRISPTVKAEWQFDDTIAVFLQGALSLNLGGNGYVSVNGNRQDFTMNLTPAMSFAFGGRKQWFWRFWTGALVGANMSLAQNNYTIVGGGAATPETMLILNAAQPGGLLVALTAGVSLL